MWNVWNMGNTSGFTQAELDAINAVVARLMTGNEDLEGGVVNAAIANEWREGLTEDELYEAAAKRLGITHQ